MHNAVLFINIIERSGKSEVCLQSLQRDLKREVVYLRGGSFRNSADKNVNDNFLVLLLTVVGINIQFNDQIQSFDTLFIFLNQYQNEHANFLS